MNFTKNIGMLLLAIYLILMGLNMLAGFFIPTILIGIVALVAGIFILIGKYRRRSAPIFPISRFAFGKPVQRRGETLRPGGISLRLT